MDQRRPIRFPTTSARAFKSPKGLTSIAARALFNRVMSEYTLENHHVVLLTEAAFALQRIEEARAAIERDGITLTDRRSGKCYANPAVSIERDSKMLLLRCIRELGLDLSEVEAPRPPIRSGVRGK